MKLLSSMLIVFLRTKDFSRQNTDPYWSTRSLSPGHPRDVMVLMFGTQSVTFWYPTSFPQFLSLIHI